MVIQGGGRVSDQKVSESSLEASGSLLFFAFILDELQPGSTVQVVLPAANAEPFSYQAAFFSNRCDQITAAVAQPAQENTPPASADLSPPSGSFEEQIRGAITEYNAVRNLSLHNSDAELLKKVTTGRYYQRENRTIQSDIETGAHHSISIRSIDIIEIVQLNDSEGSVRIQKTEDRLFFPLGCLAPDDTPPCERPKNKQNTVRGETYRVRYHIVLEDNRWKVEHAEIEP